MCGIVGIYRRTGLKADDLKRFTEMLGRCQSRGFDATGIFNSNMNLLKAHVQSSVFVRASKYIQFLEKSVGCKYIIGHCRNATRGDPKENKNNHPIPVTSDGEMIYLVHNGTVDCKKWDADPNRGKKDIEIVDTYIFANAIKNFWDCDQAAPKSLYRSTRLACEDIQRMAFSESSVIVVGNSRELVICKSRGKPLVFQVLEDGNVIMLASTDAILRPEKTRLKNGKTARVYKSVCDYSIVRIDVEAASIDEELLSTIPKPTPTVEYVDYEPDISSDSVIVINRGKQMTLTDMPSSTSSIHKIEPIRSGTRMKSGRIELSGIDDWDSDDDDIIEDTDSNGKERSCFCCSQSYKGYTEEETLVILREKRVDCMTFGDEVNFSQAKRCTYYEHE